MSNRTTPTTDAQPETDGFESEHCCDCETAEVAMQRFDTIVCAAVDVVNEGGAGEAHQSAHHFLAVLFAAEARAITSAGLPKFPGSP